MWILTLIFVLILIIYIHSKYQVNKIKNHGIKYREPVPIFGNLIGAVFCLKHLTVIFKDMYDSFQQERYFTIFDFANTSMILRDSELIKKVTIKDFDHFHDLPFQIDESKDPMFGRVLLSLKGERWHQMRSALSPAFTSFKMKNMFVFMNECGQRITEFYQDQIQNSTKKNDFQVDVHDIASRYTIDVIASTAFGFEVNSSKDRDNEFFKSACILSTPSLSLALKFTGFRVMPNVMKILGIKLLSNDAVDYFKHLIQNAIRHREEAKMTRMDMLHLLLEAKKGSLKSEEETGGHTEFASADQSSYSRKPSNIKLTDCDIIAQALVFIFGGHQSTSSLFSFLMHELVTNTDVQDRLRDEIDATIKQCDDKVSYNDIMNMRYMDMVVSESLRKWPPIPFINRLCVKDYDLGPVRDGSSDHFVVKKDENIWIPIHSIHMDPNLWDAPEKFDPERFSEENSKNIKPQSYLPFGIGPRNCLGSRFALLNLKVMLFYMINNFEFEVCSRTDIPIKVNTKNLLLEASKRVWIRMKSRKDKNLK